MQCSIERAWSDNCKWGSSTPFYLTADFSKNMCIAFKVGVKDGHETVNDQNKMRQTIFSSISLELRQSWWLILFLSLYQGQFFEVAH